MNLLKRVTRKSLIILLLSAAVSAFYQWSEVPLGIIAGGVFGILNLRGLVIAVEGLVGSERATAMIVFMSMTRLFLLFVSIFILIWFKIINVLGMLFGFTVVFVFILIEGLKVAKEE